MNVVSIVIVRPLYCVLISLPLGVSPSTSNCSHRSLKLNELFLVMASRADRGAQVSLIKLQN